MTLENKKYFEKQVKEITESFINNKFVEVDGGHSKEEYLKIGEEVLIKLCILYHEMQPKKKFLGIFNTKLQ